MSQPPKRETHMVTRMRHASVAVTLLLLLLPVMTAGAQDKTLGQLKPEGTLFIANYSDTALCRDFSPLLGKLRVEWLILDREMPPDSIRDKDLVLIGTLSSETTGLLLRSLLSAGDIALLEQNGPTILQKENPWNKGRLLMLAVGSDQLEAKKAAEKAVNMLLDAAPSRATWYRSAAAASRPDLQAAISGIQHQPSGDELPIEALTADPKASPPRSIPAEEATEDVRHFFQILEDGWCGYGTFSSLGDFAAAENTVINRLSGQKRWSPDDLTDLLREALSFVRDCHLKIGDTQFCDHLDFWYDESLSFWPASGSYHVEADGVDNELLAVNGEEPDGYLFPSLNAAGEPIYRLGVLSYHEPSPLHLSVSRDDETSQMQIPLTRGDYYTRNLFDEERLGGIPVIRAHTFADYYGGELQAFLESAERLKDEPFVILDIRGNGGGSTDWPKGWITRFTGHTPSLKQVLTELVTQTSMMGRANLYAEMLLGYPKSEASWIKAYQDRYRNRSTALANGESSPHWTGLNMPNTGFIPNDTTLIVVVDRHVASAGEGLISYLHDQVENVLVVGENSEGALTYGNITLHQLPHSRLKAYVPIKLNVMLDLEWREEQGFIPDLWLPPDQALNYVVAAVRAGTITSRIEIPGGYLTGSFTPEKVRGPSPFERSPELIPLVIMICGFVLAAFLFGRQKNYFLTNGLLLILVGVFYLLRFRQPLAIVAIALGIGGFSFGVYRRRRTAGQSSGKSNHRTR